MYLSRLSLFNFKSHTEKSLEFSPRINAIIGPNGSGKTNILDAIYMLANGKSFFNPTDSQLIKFGNPFYTIKGNFFLPNETEIQINFSEGGKKTIKKNGKAYERMVDHIGLIGAVMISPNDISLVLGNSEDRRRMLDAFMSNLNRAYLLKLVEYKKLLDQRNAMLKMYSGRAIDEVLLESIDSRLGPAGNAIYEMRKAFLKEFNPVFQSMYKRLSGGNEQPEIELDSDLQNADMDSLLVANLQKDRMLERTTEGVHRDDLTFNLDAHPLKKFGSQGQIKTFVISIKLSQFQMLKQKMEQTPLLLLDDIFEKIDDTRAQHLIDLVAEMDFGQIFITDTHKQRVETHFDSLQVESKYVEMG